MASATPDRWTSTASVRHTEEAEEAVGPDPQENGQERGDHDGHHHEGGGLVVAVCSGGAEEGPGHDGEEVGGVQDPAQEEDPRKMV
jgi:hypothetical protein